MILASATVTYLWGKPMLPYWNLTKKNKKNKKKQKKKTKKTKKNKKKKKM